MVVGIICFLAVLSHPDRDIAVVETAKGWAFRWADGSVRRVRGIEKANGYGPNCGALGRPYAETLKQAGLSRDAWCAQTAKRLRAWGFNLLGSGTDARINADGSFTTTEMIALSCWARDAGADCVIDVHPGPCGAMANPFSSQFAEICDRAARASCVPGAANRSLLGYFLDNELNWWGCGPWWEPGMLDAVLEKLPPEHSARRAAERLVRKKGGCEPDGYAKLPKAKREDLRRVFTRALAQRYFKTIVEAIRRYDPRHLVLGCRFAGVAGAPDIVWEMCGTWCDVVSLNCYPQADLASRQLTLGVDARILPDGYVRTEQWTPVPLAVMLKRRFAVAKTPLFISEWSFRGADIGQPRAESNGQELPNQALRAQAVSLFLDEMRRLPYVVGHAFYMWTDERFLSAAGVPETLNWGLVSLENAPHEQVVQAFAKGK